MNLKPEALLAKRVSNFLLAEYPNIPFRFDNGADVKLPPHIAKRLHELHGHWSRGYPDLFIATARGKYSGLYIELKATKTVANTAHTRRQAEVHAVLRHNGYKAMFCCGYDEATTAIAKYLKKKKKS